MPTLLKDPTDLNNLTYMSAEGVRAFVDEINAIALNDLKDKKLVLALATGGTISMKIDEAGQWVPDINFDSIMSHANPHLQERFLVKGFDAFQIDSSQMDYSHVRDMAIFMSYVWQHVQIPFAGFFVLHGTDTMTYSAAALSIILGQGLPFSVIYTGAQKPIQEPVNDAVTNLHNAFYTLEALYDHNMAEVVIVMGDRAILGTSSEKIDDSQVNAFDAPIHKYVARFNRLDYPIQLAPWLKEKRNLAFKPRIWDKGWSHTLLVKSHLGLSPAMIARQVQDRQVEAVLLYSYGGSTVHKPIVDVIVPIARERDISVFVVSPVNTDPKIHYESSHYMVRQGVKPLFMTLPAALAKIETGIRFYDNDRGAFEEFMTTNYVGEVPDDISRYIPAN